MFNILHVLSLLLPLSAEIFKQRSIVGLHCFPKIATGVCKINGVVIVVNCCYSIGFSTTNNNKHTVYFANAAIVLLFGVVGIFPRTVVISFVIVSVCCHDLSCLVIFLLLLWLFVVCCCCHCCLLSLSLLSLLFVVCCCCHCHCHCYCCHCHCYSCRCCYCHCCYCHGCHCYWLFVVGHNKCHNNNGDNGCFCYNQQQF